METDQPTASADRIKRPAQAGELVARVFGGSVPKEPGHFSNYTHVVKCCNCGAEFTTRAWIWGKHKFTQQACDTCISNRERHEARRTKPPAAPDASKSVKMPYKDD